MQKMGLEFLVLVPFCKNGENMANKLFEYMKKLQNAADYLLRGFVIEDPEKNTVIAILDDDYTKQRNAFAVSECSLYDELEVSYYGEQKSIGILMEYIGDDFIYENQIEKILKFSNPYVPPEEDKEFYKTTMSRINWLIRTMTMSLICGTHIPLDKYTIYGLESIYLEDDEIEVLDDEDEAEEEKKGITHYLMYDNKTDSFNVFNSNGEVYIEDVDIDVAMEIYNGFLYDQEQEELRKEAIQEYQKNSRQNLDNRNQNDSNQNIKEKDGEER